MIKYDVESIVLNETFIYILAKKEERGGKEKEKEKEIGIASRMSKHTKEIEFFLFVKDHSEEKCIFLLSST